MGKVKREEYYCDKCNKKLKTYANHVVIQTSLDKDEWANPWSRIQVNIMHHHGYHNDGEVENADLCQSCAIEILSDALARVKKGERVSKGVDEVEMLKFNQPF